MGIRGELQEPEFELSGYILIKGNEIKFELAGNLSYPSSS